MAAPVLIGVTAPTAGDALGSSTVVAVPSGVAAGDVLLAAVQVRQSTGTVITSPTGWTLAYQLVSVGATAGRAIRLAVFTRTASSSEPATHTFTHAYGYRRGGMVAYRGATVDVATSGFEDYPGSSAHTPGAVALPSPVTEGMGVTFAVCSYEPATGWTGDGVALWTNLGFAARAATVSAETTFTPPAATHSDEVHNWAAVSILLRPAEVAPTVPQVTAAFTGSGTLTASTAPVRATTSAFAGTGLLTAAVAPVVAVTAAFTGAGSFTAAADEVGAPPQVTAAFSGAGALTAAAVPVVAVDAAFAGSGALTASATPAAAMTAIDLSTFVNLWDSTTWDGTSLAPVATTASFSFPLRYDPVQAYTLEVDYVVADGKTGQFYAWGVSGPTQADADSTTFHRLALAYPIAAGTGTLSLTVGPGLANWDAAAAADELGVNFDASNMSVSAIRSSSPLIPVDTTPPASVPVVTDTTGRLGGRDRTGHATATWEPPIVPPPAGPVAGYSTVAAAAFGPVTMTGTQPTFTTSTANKTRMRHRILVGGKDVSFLNEVATPEPDYQLAEPLRWGPCTIEFPQLAAVFTNPGKGDLAWCAKGKPVVLQRVNDDTDTVVATDYRGIVIGYDVSGPTLRLECGGHGTGRAALRHRPVPIFRHTLDLGQLAWSAINTLGLRFEPRLGPTTGIRSANFGGTDHLTYIQEICAKAWDRDGTQWTIRPSDTGIYRMQRKDATTVDFTIYTDDTRAVPQLRSDAAEEPNRIFAAGVTPKGQRVRFGVYPGLKPGPAAPYPFTDSRVFGAGTTDADTDTGDGVTVMVRRLWHAGYLSLEDAEGVYDSDVGDAVEALQADAYADDGDGAGVYSPGSMDPVTWAALFDLDVTGYSLKGARVEPAAQAGKTRRYRRSASGAILGKNPRFDAAALISDRDIDFGTGFTRHRMGKWARAEIARGQDNWVGTITIKTGAVLHSEIPPGTTITADDLADVRAIEPGTNAWLPLFAGGILVHICAVQISYEEGVPQAVLTVDTQARDAMPVWEIIRRNRETKRDPARRWHPTRASGEVKDAVAPWDEVGGVLYDDVQLQPGWNVIPVVAGQEGTVSRLRLIVQDVSSEGGVITIAGREFACAVFGRRVTPKRLRRLIGNPLAASPASTAEPYADEVDPPEADPEAGDAPAPIPTPARPWWEKKAVVDELRDLQLLYAAGTNEEPCGYSPGKKTKNATRTGLHRTDAGFAYRTGDQPVLYLAVWVWGERTLTGGRVMWNQLESGA